MKASKYLSQKSYHFTSREKRPGFRPVLESVFTLDTCQQMRIFLF